MPPVFCRRMVRLGVPCEIFRILAWLHAYPGIADTFDLHFVEWFSCVRAIVRAFEAHGFAAFGYD
eukprot:7339359-Lingulodinium_polyedra.AAC.1